MGEKKKGKVLTQTWLASHPKTQQIVVERRKEESQSALTCPWEIQGYRAQVTKNARGGERRRA